MRWVRASTGHPRAGKRAAQKHGAADLRLQAPPWAEARQRSVLRRQACAGAGAGDVLARSSASRGRIGRDRPSSPALPSTTATNRISRRRSRRSSMPGHGRSSSRSDRRRSSIQASSSRERPSSRARRAAGGAARRSVHRKAGPRGADGSACSSTRRSQSCFPKPTSSCIRGDRARPARRCAPAGPCWSCPTPTISPTTLCGSASSEFLKRSAAASTPPSGWLRRSNDSRRVPK